MFKITRKNIVTSVIGLVFTICALFIFYHREWIFLDASKYCDLAPHEVGLTEEFIKASFSNEPPFDRLVRNSEGEKEVTFLFLDVGWHEYHHTIDRKNILGFGYVPTYGPVLLGAEPISSRYAYRDSFPKNFIHYIDTTLGVYKELPKTNLKRQLAIVTFFDHGEGKINGAPIQPALDHILAKDPHLTIDQFALSSNCTVYRKRKGYEIYYSFGVIQKNIPVPKRLACLSAIYSIQYGYSNLPYLQKLYLSDAKKIVSKSKKNIEWEDWIDVKKGISEKRIVNSYSASINYRPFLTSSKAFIPAEYFPQGVTKCELYAQLKRWRDGGWLGKFLTMAKL